MLLRLRAAMVAQVIGAGGGGASCDAEDGRVTVETRASAHALQMSAIPEAARLCLQTDAT